LHLALILKREANIRSWLGDEMRKAKTQYPMRPGQARNDWPDKIPEPGPLPAG
jgi:hypothetical protein